MDKVEEKLVKCIYEFIQKKGHKVKMEEGNASIAINKLVKAARQEGSIRGKAQAADFLYKTLKKAEELSNREQYDEIYRLIISAEADIRERS